MEDLGSDFFSDNSDYSAGNDSANDYTPAPVSEPEPQAPPATPSVDPQEVEALRQQIASLDRWKQDASRFFGAPPAQAQPDPGAKLQAFVNDPDQYEQGIVIQAVNTMREQLVWDSAIEGARQEKPHLTAFESSIHSDANVSEAIQSFIKTNGRAPKSGKETVDAAIKNFEQKLQGYQQASSQQSTAADLRNQAMRLGTGGSAPAPQGAKDYSAMTSDEFARARSQHLNGSYKI